MAKCLHVLLDMDETLIHGSFLHRPSLDRVVTPLGACVYLRPGVRAFLQKSFVSFASVSLFSAASTEWIACVMDVLGPEVKRNFLLVLDNRFLHNGTKDLNIIYESKIGKKHNMNSTNTILMDDFKESAHYNPNNLLHVQGWDIAVKKPREDALLDKAYRTLLDIQANVAKGRYVRDIEKPYLYRMTKEGKPVL
jgi:hypothetical protein